MIESRLSFEEFISIVKSFHFQEIVNSRGSRRRQRIFAMVFGGMEGFDEANDMYDRLQNLRAANGIKVLGSGVIKVVNRVEDARENSSLGKFKYCSRTNGWCTMFTYYTFVFKSLINM
uniref:Uncharacterized protein n=1 Tax=Lepeophtheirus salmonis TaxID=72036 RepID=A0A0K2U7U6_LEPSM